MIVNLADSRPSKPRYLLALDESKNTLKEVVSAVSRQLTTGKTKLISKEEALLIKDLTVSTYVDVAAECTNSHQMLCTTGPGLYRLSMSVWINVCMYTVVTVVTM